MKILPLLIFGPFLMCLYGCTPEPDPVESVKRGEVRDMQNTIEDMELRLWKIEAELKPETCERHTKLFTGMVLATDIVEIPCPL